MGLSTWADASVVDNQQGVIGSENGQQDEPSLVGASHGYGTKGMEPATAGKVRLEKFRDARIRDSVTCSLEPNKRHTCHCDWHAFVVEDWNPKANPQHNLCDLSW